MLVVLLVDKIMTVEQKIKIFSLKLDGGIKITKYKEYP